MSIYIMSDIHGQYNAYQKMLEKLKFSEDDFLYVLGDVIDRGPDGIEIIKDLMRRDNAELILGNHEFMLLNALEYLRDRENSKVVKKVDESLNPLELWTHPCNGGEGTCMEYKDLPDCEKEEIEAYLRGCRLIKRIKVGKQVYHLSHSYSISKMFGRELTLSKASKKVAELIVWDSLFDKPNDIPLDDKAFAYPKDIYIVGHIFTQRLGQIDDDGKGCIFSCENYRGYSVIDLDCGMALNSKSSRLGCINLETREEYYVPLLEDL